MCTGPMLPGAERLQPQSCSGRRGAGAGPTRAWRGFSATLCVGRAMGQELVSPASPITQRSAAVARGSLACRPRQRCGERGQLRAARHHHAKGRARPAPYARDSLSPQGQHAGGGHRLAQRGAGTQAPSWPHAMATEESLSLRPLLRQEPGANTLQLCTRKHAGQHLSQCPGQLARPQTSGYTEGRPPTRPKATEAAQASGQSKRLGGGKRGQGLRELAALGSILCSAGLPE